MAQLPLKLPLDQMQTQWKSILDPVIGQSSIVGFIGEVKSAMLNVSQFQSQSGSGWVLCNGQSCVGSVYSQITGNNNVPDMRGTVPRMKDNGKGLDPAGDLSLGTYQASSTAKPTTAFTTGTESATHTHGMPTRGNVGPGASGYEWVDPSLPHTADIPTNTESATHTHTITGGGDAETRAKSTILNFFIRIN